VKAVLNDDTIKAVRDKGGQLASLADKLAAKNFSKNFYLDCGGSNCTPDKNAFTERPVQQAGSEGKLTTFCSNALPPNPQAVTNSTLFHELVHQCGGGELDAWALEETFFTGSGYSRGSPPAPRYCESPGNGIPSADATGLRVGIFVMWNPTTGEVFVRVLSDGPWLSPPKSTPGTRLIGPDNWWKCDSRTLGP